MLKELVIKWSSKEFPIQLGEDETVADLKRVLQGQTQVSAKRQKLMLKTKAGKPATDQTVVADLNVKPNQKIMMIGTADAAIEALSAQAEVQPHVQDDLEDELDANIEIDIRRRPEVVEKLQRRIKQAIIKKITDPREGKKCLVVDIDYTIFALDSNAENANDLARPFLHEFFTAAYVHYDIIIWSATSMKWIDVKLKELGISTHPEYKVTACLDYTGMVTVETSEKGVFDCKPLAVVWENFEEYHPGNTIMLDDLRRNYCLNPQNGLVIKPYKKAHRNRAVDRELLYLKYYLNKIAELESLESLDHDRWTKYIKYELRQLQQEEEEDVQEQQ